VFNFYKEEADGEKKKGCRKENISLQPCTKVFGLMERGRCGSRTFPLG